MYTIQVPEPEGSRVHATWFQAFPVLKLNDVENELPCELTNNTATRVPSEHLVNIILSDATSVPKSNKLVQLPLLSDLHQVANVRPPSPVVNESMLIYWLLTAESTNWLLETTAPFCRVAS
jgi:hypothetical protein